MSANAKEDNIDDFDQNQCIQEQLIKATGGHSNLAITASSGSITENYIFAMT